MTTSWILIGIVFSSLSTLAFQQHINISNEEFTDLDPYNIRR
jgi:hypothetical protein